MADSHKFNADGRPIVYGEPELVYAFSSICVENGATPVVIASGIRSNRLTGLLATLLADEDEQPVIFEETDFAAIDEAGFMAGANIAIGHSGGKFLTERRGIPVIRVGFPIHDRTGGQRILSAGYTGTLAFLDRFTNALLETKYDSYRELRKEEMGIREGA
jgi:nitrogenase molybdenum-iron protein NifN